MQVYKALFKIIQKNIPQIIIYIVVFMTVAIGMSNLGSNPGGMDFTEAKINIAFISYDDSALSEGLESYLGKITNMIDRPDDKEMLQDALFFREIEYIVRVPKGFAEDLMSGKAVKIEKTAVSGSVSEVYLDNVINKYVNTAKTYISNTDGLSDQQLTDLVMKDLEQKAEVKLNRKIEEVSKSQKVSYHFNYMAYSLFAVLILGVSTVMLVFHKRDLRNRNLCSPITPRSMNTQLILGNLSYAVLAWIVITLPSLLMFGSFMFTVKGRLFMLNSFVFTLSALSISFLISILVKGPGAVSATANVISLGSSFISGVMVPQELLGDTVLRIGSFTPTYWYVKSNNEIAKMAEITMNSFTPVLYNMLIVFGFAVASLAVALVASKHKRTA